MNMHCIFLFFSFVFLCLHPCICICVHAGVYFLFACAGVNVNTTSPHVAPAPTWTTAAKMCISDGSAACIDLEGCGLDSFDGKPTDADHKHMTVVWRKEPHWTPKEIAAMQHDCDEWKARNCGANNRVEFTLTRWGQHSCYIHGPLHDLCMHLRKLQDKRAPIGEQRPAHVEVFQKKDLTHSTNT